MKKKGFIRVITALTILAIVLGTAACTAGPAEEQTGSGNSDVPADLPDTGTGKVQSSSKEIIVYFPNWKLDEENGNVCDIPWDRVTFINHAFWAVAPTGDENESSFERRKAGLEARTQFQITSTLPEADAQIFPQYAEYSRLYPEVNIMISVGGWSACGYFSEMAYTPEGRASFINSCIELIDANPWIDGIDIDWEYPAGSNDGERYPENEYDQGCPIWGTALEDMRNFPAFLKEMREALDAHYGAGAKYLTACASSSTGWTLPNQDWTTASKYLDYINIMTYDMAGDWDNMTGLGTNVSGTKNAMAYFINHDIPAAKLNLGSPLYGTPFKMAESDSYAGALGAPIEIPGGIDGEMLVVPFIRSIEAEACDSGTPGWHTGYNDVTGGGYIFNDDPSSPHFRWFISYETKESLDGKFALIEKYKLAGMIVWEVTQDTTDHEMINYMNEKLRQ